MKKILLVDDSFVIQELLSRFFSNHSQYLVYTAEDGEGALDQIQNNPPDLILLDIILPKVNGIEFLKQLKNDDTTAHIPVILMSGTMVDDQAKRDGLAAGAIEFLTKPFDMQHLLDVVNDLFPPEDE